MANDRSDEIICDSALVCGMQSLSKHPSLVNKNLTETVTPLTAEAYDISTAACLDIFTDL